MAYRKTYTFTGFPKNIRDFFIQDAIIEDISNNTNEDWGAKIKKLLDKNRAAYDKSDRDRDILYKGIPELFHAIPILDAIVIAKSWGQYKGDACAELCPWVDEKTQEVMVRWYAESNAIRSIESAWRKAGFVFTAEVGG